MQSRLLRATRDPGPSVESHNAPAHAEKGAIVTAAKRRHRHIVQEVSASMQEQACPAAKRHTGESQGERNGQNPVCVANNVTCL